MVWGPHAVFVRGPRMDILLCESRVMVVGPVLIGEARTLRLVSSMFAVWVVGWDPTVSGGEFLSRFLERALC